MRVGRCTRVAHGRWNAPEAQNASILEGNRGRRRLARRTYFSPSTRMRSVLHRRSIPPRAHRSRRPDDKCVNKRSIASVRSARGVRTCAKELALNVRPASTRLGSAMVFLIAAGALVACAVGTTTDSGGDTTSQAPTDPAPPPETALPAKAPAPGTAATPASSAAPASSADSGASPPSSRNSSSGSPAAACTSAAPTATAPCSACGTKPTCQANGCFNGYWCNLTTTKCTAKPAGC